MGSKLIIPEESLELQKLVASSMSRFTFGIVQPSKRGVENQELATGVGVKWNGMHLILTAEHVVRECPEETLRFFLPAKNIEFAMSADPRPPAEVRTLMELANPTTPILADDLDLAVIKLSVQTGAAECFVPLQNTDTSPKDGAEVGVFGYPRAAKIPLDANFIASPLHFFGNLDVRGRACSHPPRRGLLHGPLRATLWRRRIQRKRSMVLASGTGVGTRAAAGGNHRKVLRAG